MLLRFSVFLTTLVAATPARVRRRFDRGQATAEYALVLLGAATVALLLVAWATQTGKVTALLDAIVDRILDRA